MITDTPRAIIEIRQKKIGHGWATLYISYTPAVIDMNKGLSLEKEDLGIKVYTNPKSPEQEKFNKGRYAKAKLILKQRQSDFNDGYLRLLSGDFVSFYRYLSGSKSYNLTASLKQFIKFAGDRCPFGRINTDFIYKYHTFLECRAATSKGKFLANSTVTLYISQIMTVCRAAITKGYLSEDNIAGVSLSYLPANCNHVSLAELKRLYRCSKRDHRVERLLSLQLLTGLPFSYILKIEAKHLCLDEFGNWVLDVPGKRGKRTHISNEAAEIILCITDGKSIFDGISYPEVNLYFKQWVTNAGLKKSYRLRNFRLQIDSLEELL